VNLDAAPTDLQHMVSRKLTRYKHIYLDDGVTGADLDRPGFTAFRRDARANVHVSHVLIHMPDRFARPEQASNAMLMEQELQHAGITVVFSSRVAPPRRRGERNSARTCRRCTHTARAASSSTSWPCG
jgi:hypothetical protein